MLREIEEKLEKELAKIKAARLIGQNVAEGDDTIDKIKMEYGKFGMPEKSELFAFAIFGAVWSIGSIVEFDCRFLFDTYFSKQHLNT